MASAPRMMKVHSKDAAMRSAVIASLPKCLLEQWVWHGRWKWFAHPRFSRVSYMNCHPLSKRPDQSMEIFIPNWLSSFFVWSKGYYRPFP